MKTSANGRKFIEGFEGLFLHTYNDGTGVLTIGYGHTTAAGPPHVVPGMAITAPQADEILSADLASVEADVNRLVTVPINQNQFDALVSFHFNTGALARANVLHAVNNKQFDAVPGDLNQWVRGGGHVMLGLVRRRKAEGVLFLTAPAASS
jgi:lysozyme